MIDMHLARAWKTCIHPSIHSSIHTCVCVYIYIYIMLHPDLQPVPIYNCGCTEKALQLGLDSKTCDVETVLLQWVLGSRPGCSIFVVCPWFQIRTGCESGSNILYQTTKLHSSVQCSLYTCVGIDGQLL